jgi:hypothetical protein
MPDPGTSRRTSSTGAATSLSRPFTLHRRFPYAVLSAWLFLDAQAAHDQTDRRRSTFQNAFPRLRLFTGRQDPAGREEQFERLYLLLLDTNPFTPNDCYHVADPSFPVDIDEALTDLVNLVGERNFDLYEAMDGGIRKI